MHTHVAMAKAKAAKPHTTPTSVMILCFVISAGTKKRPAATAEDARGDQRIHLATMRAARIYIMLYCSRALACLDDYECE